MKTAKELLEENYSIWGKIDDDNLSKKVLIEFAEEYASQLTPSIPKIEWRDDWEAWIGDYKIGYVEESERNMWFGSCVFSNTVYLGIYSTKQLAKQAVVDNWNNFISKVVVMEQISDDDAKFIWELMPTWVREPREMNDPTMQGTLTSKGDLEIHDRVKNILSRFNISTNKQISDEEIEEWAKSTLPNFGIDPSDCTVENTEIHDHYFQQYRDKIEGAKYYRDKQKG